MSHFGRLLHRCHHQIQQQQEQNAAIDAFRNAFDPVNNAIAGGDEGNLDWTVIDVNFDATAAGGMINWGDGGINGEGGVWPEGADEDSGGGDGNDGEGCDVDGIHNSVWDIIRNLVAPYSTDSYMPVTIQILDSGCIILFTLICLLMMTLLLISIHFKAM